MRLARTQACDMNTPGDFVECGVWKGGCSFGMLLYQELIYGRVLKSVWKFDSFEGLPTPTGVDSQAAFGCKGNTNHAEYRDNLAVDIEWVRAADRAFCVFSTGDVVCKTLVDDVKRHVNLPQPGSAIAGIDRRKRRAARRPFGGAARSLVTNLHRADSARCV
jgi:hypothetical protein